MEIAGYSSSSVYVQLIDVPVVLRAYSLVKSFCEKNSQGLHFTASSTTDDYDIKFALLIQWNTSLRSLH